MQLATEILMIRPAAFGFNPETAKNNYFQNDSGDVNVSTEAREAFDEMTTKLAEAGIHVFVFEDREDVKCPSAVFPNNWLATSPDGGVFVFPMFAPSRRMEKRDDILQWLREAYEVNTFQDWTEFEAEARFLEGTGSMVMDHENRILFAALSQRTDLSVLEKFARAQGYRAMPFNAVDEGGRAIYHTNVMMCLGEGFAIVCMESIADEAERIAVRQLIESTDREIISISYQQMNAFAGNMLQLQTAAGSPLLVCSQTAFDSLTEEQRNEIERHTKILPLEVSVIEKAEGGSVRCMIAEIFLRRKILNERY